MLAESVEFNDYFVLFRDFWRNFNITGHFVTSLAMQHIIHGLKELWWSVHWQVPYKLRYVSLSVHKATIWHKVNSLLKLVVSAINIHIKITYEATLKIATLWTVLTHRQYLNGLLYIVQNNLECTYLHSVRISLHQKLDVYGLNIGHIHGKKLLLVILQCFNVH